MKRSEVLAKLEKVEGITDELKKEIVEFVMSENGKDIEKTKENFSDYETKLAEREQEIKEYQQGGKRYIDINEFNRLREFETKTMEKQTADVKSNAVLTWLKENKASEKALGLLSKAVDFSKVEVQDGKIKDVSLLEPLKTDYKDFFVTETQGGVLPLPAGKSMDVDPFLAGFKMGS